MHGSAYSDMQSDCICEDERQAFHAGLEGEGHAGHLQNTPLHDDLAQQAATADNSVLIKCLKDTVACRKERHIATIQKRRRYLTYAR